MTPTRHQGGWVIAATLFTALALSIVPIPDLGFVIRPEWTALVLIYWCLALPQRVGVGVSWVVGALQDVLQGTLLGAHALAFALLAFLTMKVHQRLRVFPLWQQALTVLILLLMVRVILMWVHGLIDQPTGDWTYWVPALTGTLIWPVVFVLLRGLRRHYNVQ